ncbi:MAG: hypothetical protein MJ245_05240 [Clostridia bacterium]|nr:hypothetical protein [Clostridia bacterium]
MNEVKLKIKKDKNKNITTIYNISFFDLYKTLDSGQTFRYRYIDNDDKNKGCYVYVRNICTLLKQKINNDDTTNLIIESIDDEVINTWIDFFNLKLDYDEINNDAIKKNKSVKKLIDNAKGVRVIHTDLFESIITFIISANNNMKRIKYSVELLAERYGKLILNDKNNDIKIYQIPNEKIINKLSLDDIRNLKVGFRDKYIKDATSKIVNKEISLDKIKLMNANDAKLELMKIKGVGDKVADCIRLTALNKFEAFPVDTWIEKYMLSNDLKSNVKKGITYSRKEIEEYGMKKYGKYAGIIQQYIFYSLTNNK